MPQTVKPIERLVHAVNGRAFSDADLELLRFETEKRILRLSLNAQQNGFAERIETRDVRIVFEAIDEAYFAGLCAEVCESQKHNLTFRLGKRMTRSGGKTTTRFLKGAGNQKQFEIAISPRLIAETFQQREAVLVTGLICLSPLQALTRIMEHEMLHMIEMLIWSESSCSRARFRNIANRLFGHRQSNHHLLTPQEMAKKTHNVQIGSQVSFNMNNKLLHGFVNHINRRATVLVHDATGVRYKDGNRYAKYYVPLDLLRIETTR